jgi:hypothetical protein
VAQRLDRSVPNLMFGFVGLIVVVNAIAFFFGRFFPQALAMVPPLLLVGIAMSVFPGTEPPQGLPDNVRARLFYERTPAKYKWIWAAAAAAGIPPGIYLIYRLGAFAT